MSSQRSSRTPVSPSRRVTSPSRVMSPASPSRRMMSPASPSRRMMSPASPLSPVSLRMRTPGSLYDLDGVSSLGAPYTPALDATVSKKESKRVEIDFPPLDDFSPSKPGRSIYRPVTPVRVVPPRTVTTVFYNIAPKHRAQLEKEGLWASVAHVFAHAPPSSVLPPLFDEDEEAMEFPVFDDLPRSLGQKPRRRSSSSELPLPSSILLRLEK